MKSVRKLVPGFLLGLVLSCILYHAQVTPTVRTQDENGGITSMLTSDYAGSAGYQIEGRRFCPINTDPQMYFQGNWPEMSNIQLQFTEPVENEIGIQLFYCKENEELSEEHSVSGSIDAGDKSCVIEIPEGKYGLLRLDIDGEVSLAGITMSDKPVVQYRLARKINVMQTVILFLFSIVFAWIFGGKLASGIRKAAGRFGTEWREQHPWMRFMYLADVVYILLCLIQIFYRGTIHRWYLFLLWVSAGILLLSKFIRYAKTTKHMPEKLFLAVILITGSLCSITLPLGTQVGFDDEIHYRTANELSHFFDRTVSDAERTYFYAYHEDMSDPVYVSQRKCELDEQYKTGRTHRIGKLFRMDYTVIPYIPSAVLMFLARGLGAPVYAIFELGRLLNVFIYAGLTYFSMRRLKSSKMILAVIALFPTCIFLAGNYSCDTWLTGFTMLGISYILGAAMESDQKLSRRELAVILLSFVIGLSPKQVYFPVMLLGLILGKEKFRDRKAWRRYQLLLLAAMLFVAATFVVPILLGGFGTGDIRGSVDVNSTEQVRFVLKNPYTYTVVLVKFLIKYLSIGTMPEYITNFAYMGSTRGAFLVSALLLFTTVTDKTTYDTVISNWKVKIWEVLLFGGTCVLIASALYVSYTPVAEEGIWGCQPRYLIPLLFPLLAVIGSSRVQIFKKKRVYHLAILAVMSILLFCGIFQMSIGVAG